MSFNTFWFMAARNAKQRHVTIHTIGIGSDLPTTVMWEGQLYPVSFDESTLREIASQTGGEYFRVFEEQDFQEVYEAVRKKSIRTEEQTHELTALCSFLAFGILLMTVVGSLTVGRRFF